MISTFDLKKLQSLLKDFYTLSHIRITVFDETFHELVAYPENISQFCQIIRKDKNAKEKCMQCDAKACKIASQRHTPYSYYCHAGLKECITPLYLGNIVIGYLFYGHVFSYPTHEEGWNIIKKQCSSYHINFDELKKACRERPIISESHLSSATHIMQAVASYLCMERMVILKHKELPVQIDEYISQHFTEDLNAQTLCETFKIGKTLLYEFSKQNYGIGIAEHIRNLRIEKAKSMLIEYPNMRINEIAAECGYNDYNYFITVFRKTTGISPKQYRVTIQ